MRKLMFIIAMLFSMTVTSQDVQVGVSVAQDMKLLLQKDDYGNTPPTIDVVLKVILKDAEYKRNYMSFYAQHEFADLSDAYRRYALGGGYNYEINSLNLLISPSVNVGFIRRWEDIYFSYEFQTELVYLVTDRMGVVLMYSLTDRAEIDVVRSNVYLGMKYLFKRKED